VAHLIDRNANPLAHDYAAPPYRLGAIYIVYSPGSDTTLLKVGAVEIQSKDVVDVLRGVQRRVRLAIPCTCAGSRRKPSRPLIHVWVVLSTLPALRHELEQTLVDEFGDRRLDPAHLRRREFCPAESFDEIRRVIDMWRMAFPDALSESLYSDDAGASYVAPRSLLPYVGQTEDLCMIHSASEEVRLRLPRRCVPAWAQLRGAIIYAAGRDARIAQLMRGHRSHRVERLQRAFYNSPAVASKGGLGHHVVLADCTLPPAETVSG